VVGKPAGVDLSDVAVTSSANADAVIVFAKTLADMLKQGVQAVRQVAIDEVWSALRFRPAK